MGLKKAEYNDVLALLTAYFVAAGFPTETARTTAIWWIKDVGVLRTFEWLKKEEVKALRIHTEGMQNPTYRQNYIAGCTSNVRICYATGHYSVADLAVLFDLPSKDVAIILRGCG